MKFLIDTNIFLEIILNQERAEEAKKLLNGVFQEDLSLSDYSLHSIGTILVARNRHVLFQQFIEDVIINARIKIISLLEEDLIQLVKAAKKFRLDFDDAYQYLSAKKYRLTLISFDKDFDRTDLKRKTPAELEVEK